MDCREQQTKALKDILTEDTWPSAVSLHGAPGTGKTTILKKYLTEASFTSSWVQCDQCMTARILLQRALRNIFLTTKTGTTEDAVCENIDIFVTLVNQKFKTAQYDKRHVLVLDRIDRLPEYRATLDLFSCFSRIRELAPDLTNLVVIFISSTAEPQALIANATVPRIWFPRYTKEEALILLKHSEDETCPGNQSPQFKDEFVELVFNALFPNTGTEISQLKRFAQKIWPSFIADTNSAVDSVAKIYVRKAYLFSAERITDKLDVPPEAEQLLRVSPISSYLLCAAYLASYNSPRYDMRYFSLAKTMRNKRRETRPKKSATIPARSLAPPAFEMERFLAIFHAIHPDAFTFQPTNQVGREIATLTAQNLIVKTQQDPLDSRTKWKINVPWSYVQRLATEIGFNIEDYLVEA